MSYYDNEIPFSTLVGKTLSELNIGNESIEFVTTEGESFNMYHSQDCCEHVYVEDVAGDVEDMLGTPILLAEESTNSEDTSLFKKDPDGYDYHDSFTWTFYKLGTAKGYLTIRWLGESNGYYSESVSFAYTGKKY